MKHASLILAVAAAAVSPALHAAHAWQLPVTGADAAGGAWRIDLPPEVYARIVHADLRDFEARNALGEAIPFGPVPQPWAAPAPAPVEQRALEAFALPRAEGGAPGTESLRLVVERDAAGVLRRIDVGTDAAVDAAGELLFDAGDVGPALLSLSLELEGAADAFRARVEVLASDDLDAWRPVGTPQSVLRLRDGQRVLQRGDLDLGGLRARYLRVRRVDDGVLPARRATLRTQAAPVAVADWPQVRQVDATLVRSEAPGEFIYAAPGPIPVDAIELVPADLNSTAEVSVASRDDEAGAWSGRTSGTVFRVAVDGGEAASLPWSLPAVRARQWRVTSDPPLARAPRLRLSYTPDSWVLLAQGPAPYHLVAGSRDAVRPDYPLGRVLDQLARQRGPAFTLPLASVAAGSALDAAALEPAPTPLPWRRIVLWGVLAAGALAIVVLVMRLLREREPAA